MLSSAPIFHIEAEVGEIQHFGITPYGERRVIDIVGGRVHGPRLQGRVLPGGTDRQVIRTDGVTDLQARYAIETDSGARILVNSDGLRHGPAEVLRFETADPAHAWLNRIIALAAGTRERLHVRLDVYEVL
jgi:hypothetical protein